jgi:putative peptide zinc metalloprotease protein
MVTDNIIQINDNYEVHKVNDNKYIVKNKYINKYIYLSKKNLTLLIDYIENNNLSEEVKNLINYLNSIGFFSDKNRKKDKTLKIAIEDIDKVIEIVYLKIFSRNFYLTYFILTILIGVVYSLSNFYINSALVIPWIIINIFIHEFGHAITCKHYKRKINSAGFKIYYIFPVFYIDTTDICMSSKKSKILVSLLGPLSNFMLFIGLLLGGFITNYYNFELIYFSMMFFIFNLIPLFKLDGYYILNDLLEINSLQKYSNEYIKSKFMLDLRLGRVSKKYILIVAYYICEKIFKLFIIIYMINYFTLLVKSFV